MAIVRKTLSSQRHQNTPEEVARLRAQNDARPDDDIDYSDIPQQSPKDWEHAVQGRLLPSHQKAHHHPYRCGCAALAQNVTEKVTKAV